MRAMLPIAKPGEVIRRHLSRVLRTDDEVSSNQSSARLTQPLADARQLHNVGSRAAPPKQEQAKVRRAEVGE
jgi:hypothetical protein